MVTPSGKSPLATRDPLNLSELCLVSMALYQRGDERLFLPHVVSAVQTHQRELAIRIVVETPDGMPLAARADGVTTQEAVARERADVAEFLSSLRFDLDREMAERYDLAAPERPAVPNVQIAAPDLRVYDALLAGGAR
jgi:hypothetical protein